MTPLSKRLDTLTLSRFIVKTGFYQDPSDGVAKQILASTASGEAVLIGENAGKAIQEGHFESLPEELLGELIATKLLVDGTVDELVQVVKDNKAANNDPEVLKITIQPTNSCQLGCNIGGYCGQSHGSKRMDTALQQKMLERIEYQLKKGGRKQLKVSWFGAEPLTGLSTIRNLTPKLKSLAQKYSVKYSANMVSNGMQLFPVIFDELTQQHGVDHIDITLDGSQESHDKRRATKKKAPTFKHIWHNLESILKRPRSRGIISIRANVDHSNVNDIAPLVDKMAEAGWADKIAYFYTAPVRSWGKNGANTGMSKEEFARFEINMMAYMMRRGFKVALLPSRVKSTCTATHIDNEMFDAFGEIHKCTETSYVKAYETGNPKTGAVNIHAIGKAGDENRVLDERHTQNSLSQFMGKLKDYPCSKCFFLPACGGACPKEWEEGGNPCPAAKFNIEQRLLLAWANNRLGNTSIEASQTNR